MTTRRQFLTHATLPVAAAVALSVPVVARAADPNPDAELLELGRRREAILEAFNVPGGVPDEEANRLGDEWLALDHQIMTLTPKTGAGIAVQIAVVWRDIGMAPGEENGPTPQSHRSMVWLWQIKQNAACMAGGVA